MDATENRYSLAYKQIARAANDTLPLKKLVSTIAASAARGLQASGCAVMLLNPRREYLDILGAWGLSDLYLRKGAINARKSYPDILDGKIVAVEDICTDKRTHPASWRCPRTFRSTAQLRSSASLTSSSPSTRVSPISPVPSPDRSG
jgi:hypothetical protein